MEIIGIIAEYNPFHNGHIYHINKIKEKYKDSTIICVCSQCFTEHGDISILNKWDKTKIALDNGIDILIELPYAFSSQSADTFAKGGIKILNELKVNKIIFGSETNDIKLLYEAANKTINNIEFENKIKEHLKNGTNYKTASILATKEITNTEILTPNDTLGLCYIKEILKNNYNITAETIKRTNEYNSKETTGKISSATSIREKLKINENINEYVPNEVTNKVYNKNEIDKNYFKLLKYKIISSNDLSIYNTVDEGIENNILKNINKANNLKELIDLTKSKRYSIAKLKRMFNHILVGFTKELAKKHSIEYIRILGLSKKGIKYLNKIKKEVTIPIITKFIKNDMLNFEKRITNIYSMIVNDKSLIEKEYKNKPIIKP